MRVRALAICFAVVLCVGGVLVLVITRPGVVFGPWEPAIRSKTSSSFKNRSPVTMVVVTCANRPELTMNNLKSAVAFSRAPLRLLLYADVENIKRLQDRTMLGEEDAVLYVDSDIVFFRPVEELWSIFDNMDDIQLAALAPDVEDYNGSVYMHNWKTRYYGRYGLNSGVILMNLTRMRAYGLESLVMNLMDKYHSVMKLPDQDLLNMVFHDDPGRLYELPCRWDVLPPDCRAPASCLGQTAASLHGTDQFFVFPGREPAYHAVFLAMKKYQLGSSLEQNFIDVLERSLRSLNQTVCVGKLLGYLEHWRKLARLMDVEKDWNAS